MLDPFILLLSAGEKGLDSAGVFSYSDQDSLALQINICNGQLIGERHIRIEAA